MEKLLLLVFDLGLGITYLIGAIVLMLLIQLISYRVFHKNIYKWLSYNLIDRYM